MTDLEQAELTDFLAGVMGWDKGRGPFWWRESGQPVAFLHENAIEQFPYVKFNPPHDHNHMALVRAKMRERGWLRKAVDWVGRGTEVWFVHTPSPFLFGRQIICPNELIAEGLAVKAAVEKERDSDAN